MPHGLCVNIQAQRSRRRAVQIPRLAALARNDGGICAPARYFATSPFPTTVSSYPYMSNPVA
jgi:hypothetical protein